MHEAPGQAWPLADLARVAGMSRSVFAERFREHTGWTPAQYLTHWRMRCARDLLATGMTLAEVAERVGYADEFGFAKAFKRVFDEAPGAARRRLAPVTARRR
ncbi:MAG: AraC-like DNA-binding protein [Myxococcota bacterium]|jgi:AraC-like DNA-binding protein